MENIFIEFCLKDIYRSQLYIVKELKDFVRFNQTSVELKTETQSFSSIVVVSLSLDRTKSRIHCNVSCYKLFFLNKYYSDQFFKSTQMIETFQSALQNSKQACSFPHFNLLPSWTCLKFSFCHLKLFL